MYNWRDEGWRGDDDVLKGEGEEGRVRMVRSMKPSNERCIKRSHKTVIEPQWTF